MALFSEMMEESGALREEIWRLRKGIQDYIDGNWGHEYRQFLTKHDQCPHNKFEWEDCGNCIDEYFAKLLKTTTVTNCDG